VKLRDHAIDDSVQLHNAGGWRPAGRCGSRPRSRILVAPSDPTMASSSSAARHDPVAHMVAGAMSGLLTSILVHPLDLIRTRMQVHAGPGSRYKGIADAFVSIRSQDGWRGLWQGLSPSLVGSGISWGLFMFFYDMFKSKNASFGFWEAASSFNHLISAAEAGS
jgi:hypothetical protein